MAVMTNLDYKNSSGGPLLKLDFLKSRMESNCIPQTGIHTGYSNLEVS